jgi:zinc/manganese transport system substrate-binding protein
MSRGAIGLSALFAAVVALVVGLGLREAPAAAPAGRIGVVAAENVYGDIAAQIGGRHVTVTSILADPNADPHLYTPSSRDALAVARARVVVENGAGYDSFVGRLLAAAPSVQRTVVVAAHVLHVHGAGANPHLWYDLPRIDRVGAAIAAALGRADPAHRAAYRRGLARFDRSLTPLRRALRSIRERDGGDPVAYTEPVPGYVVAAAGLRNLTPAAFARAVEDGSEPSPQAVSAMTALLTGRRVRLLLLNTQAVSPLTTRMRAAARSAGRPVVGVTELLPPGETYQAWQLRQLRELARGLRR